MLKLAVLRGLKINIDFEHRIQEFGYLKRQKLGKSILKTWLRVVQKEKFLQRALIETLESRRKNRICAILRSWNKEAGNGIDLTNLIERNVRVVLFRRVFRQIGKVQQYRQHKKEIQFNSRAIYQAKLKEKAVSWLKTHCSTAKALEYRKARKIKKNRLYTQAFSALKTNLHLM